MSPIDLAGVFSVLPTAFDDTGRLDLDGTAALARAHVDAGVSGLTALGVMGEAAELTEDERADVLAAVISASGRVPVVVGISGPTQDVVARRALDSAAAGARGVMVSPTASLGLLEAVRAAAAGDVGIVIQDYLAGSGVALTAEDIVRAAEAEPLVVAVKAETPPTSGLIATLAQRRPSLGRLGGLGGLFLIDELRAGATGTMTGFAMPERLVAIVAGFATDREDAERRWSELLPLMRLEAFPPYSLAARKEVWRLRGVIASAHCRRQGAVLDERARDDVRRALARVGG